MSSSTQQAPGRRAAGRTRAWVTLKLLAAFLGFSALVTEVATLVARHQFEAGNFLSYFTVEANTLAVISLVLSALALVGTPGGSANPNGLSFFRGAVALYMTTTILIFIVLLSGYPASKLTAVPWDNTVLHYVMPIAIIIDWVLTGPGRAVAYRSAALWLVFPLAYLVYSLIRGPLAHWYPYPFMDPSAHGYLRVAITSAVIAIVLAGIAWVLARIPGWTSRSVTDSPHATKSRLSGDRAG